MGAWFASVMVDPGSPFGRGTEISNTGRTDLTLESPSPLVGYCILNAENLEAAEELVKECPSSTLSASTNPTRCSDVRARPVPVES